MPRVVSLVNTQSVTNNPTAGISFSNLANLPAILAQQPSLSTTITEWINNLLTQIDDVTGLDFLSWAQALEELFSGNPDGLLAALAQAAAQADANWTTLLESLGLNEQTASALAAFLSGISETASQAEANWTTIFEALGLSESTATELATWLTNLDTNATDAWNNWVTTLDNLGQETVTDLSTWLSGINNTAQNAQANWTTLFEDLGTTASTSAELASFLTDLSTGNFAGVLEALFGSASSPGILGSIPSTAVTNTTQNLQPVFDFPNSTSVTAGGQWSFSSTIDHTGKAGSGSAQCAANGQLNQLIGVPGAVQPDQTVTPLGYVTWSGLTATGSPIQLQLIPWSGTSEPGTAGTAVTPTGCEITSPGASSSTYAGAVEVDGVWWVPLTGTYTVPTSGVGFVQLCLTVTAAATAGTANFDDCSADVTGGYLANIENNLTDLQNESTASTNALKTFLQSWLTAIDDYTSWSTYIAAVETAWNTYWTTESGLASDEIFTLQQLLNSLLGINTSTGQMSLASIESSLGLTSLEADMGEVVTSVSTAWNNLVTGAENTWNSLFGAAPTTSTQTIGQEVVSGLQEAWAWLTGQSTSPTTGATVTAAVAASALPTVSIGGVSNTIEGHLQAIVDANANALGVSTTTGNPVSAITTGLTAIPAGNVVGSTGAAVTFGASGAGNAAAFVGGATASISWSHTIATGDLGVLVFVGYQQEAGESPTSAVTYGGTAMTMLQRETSSLSAGFGSAVIEAWWLKSPPSGAKTVAVSLSGSNFNGVVGDSASYSASKIGTVGPNTGGGSASLSMSAASTTGHMVAGAFASVISSQTPSLSAYNQTSHYNNSSTAIAFVMGDAAGASSVAFSATSSVPAGYSASQVQWSGITVELEN